MTPAEAFASLNRATGLPPLPSPAFTGIEPLVPTPFAVGTAAAASLGVGASAVEEIWRIRGGARQEISIDLSAAAESLVSFGLLRLDGVALPRPSEHKPTVGFYRTGDGRWIHLHGGFPHLEKRTLDLLNAENNASSVTAAVAKWNSAALEETLAYLGQCGAVARTEEEWRASAAGLALDQRWPLVIRRIGDAPPLALEKGEAPLDGIRVLDLTRVLAGPTVGRTLASYGADVLSIRAERLPTIDLFDLDTGHGKRSAFLDLAEPANAELLRSVARDAHVFVDSYRPGALRKFGFTPAALSHASPGIIFLSVSCYGEHGPWAARRGWEQLAQSATGIALDQGAFMAARSGSRRETVPRLIPAAACDYITGYLGAAGVAAALLRRMRDGGSWHVEISLCATAMWLQSLGKFPIASIPDDWDPRSGLDAYMKSCQTEQGRLDFLGPVVRMSETPPGWRTASPRPGSDRPRWN